MENTKASPMAALLKQIDQSDIRRQMVPMDLGMSHPVVCQYGQSLVVKVFFYRALPRENDKTQLFAPAYEMAALWPSGKIVSCRGLRYEDENKEDWSRPVGFFRHEALKSWTRAQFKQARADLCECFDSLIAYLLEQSDEFSMDAMKTLVSALYEPSLIPFYRRLSAVFIDQFYRGETAGEA